MKQQVNLYQPIFRKQEKKFSAKAMLQAIAVILVGMVGLFAWTQWQVIELRSDIARADQQLSVVSKRLLEVTQQFGGRARVAQSADEEIARLERGIASHQRVREILSRGLFSNTQGFSEYFAAFARQSRHAPDISLTGFDIVGAAEQMTLQGRSATAEAVPRYVQKLGAERRLAGIEFQVFQMSRAAVPGKGAGTVVDFTLKTAGGAPGQSRMP